MVESLETRVLLSAANGVVDGQSVTASGIAGDYNFNGQATRTPDTSEPRMA
jgi:hypothetical protein